MVRRLTDWSSEPYIAENQDGEYVLYTDYATLEAENAELKEELERVSQCYLTLRECRGVRKDSETKLACGSGDIVRIECKKMGEMREALREMIEATVNEWCQQDCDWPCPESVVCKLRHAINKAREVLGDAPLR